MWAGPECRVNCIKGEIHNVMAVMRSDARYASPLRFQSEMLPQGREEDR